MMKKKIAEMEAKDQLNIEIKEIDEDLIKVEDALTKNNYDKQELDIELSQKGVDYYDKKKGF